MTVIAAMMVGACVIAPVPASSEVTRVDNVTISDDLLVTVGPRRLIEDVSGKIREQNKDIDIVDPLVFRDAAFPGGGWSLRELLSSDRCNRVAAKLDVQYLVLLTFGRAALKDESGFFFPMLIGAMSAEEETALSAAIVDLKSRSLMCLLNAKSTGTGRIFHYVLFIVATDPATEKAVVDGLSKAIADTLSPRNGSARTRIAVLAGEGYRHTEDSEKPGWKSAD